MTIPLIRRWALPLAVGVVVLGLLLATTWRRVNVATSCRPVDPPELADYYGHAWTMPDGTVVGWSRTETGPVYPSPTCLNK